jgi:hypothetical protein
LDQDGTVYNRFRVEVANRGHEQAVAQFSIEGLPGTKFVGLENAIVVGPDETVEREFEIAAPPSASLAPGVNHFVISSRVGNERDSAEETFITPSQDSR